MPALDVIKTRGPARPYTQLHNARPVLLSLGEPGRFDLGAWANPVQLIEARYDGTWELLVIGTVAAPGSLLICPDGYVASVGDQPRIPISATTEHVVRATHSGVTLPPHERSRQCQDAPAHRHH
jgi:3-(3-hydroxy-phenyl)propionate hydroxylase